MPNKKKLQTLSVSFALSSQFPILARRTSPLARFHFPRLFLQYSRAFTKTQCCDNSSWPTVEPDSTRKISESELHLVPHEHHAFLIDNATKVGHVISCCSISQRYFPFAGRLSLVRRVGEHIPVYDSMRREIFINEFPRNALYPYTHTNADVGRRPGHGPTTRRWYRIPATTRVGHFYWGAGGRRIREKADC